MKTKQHFNCNFHLRRTQIIYRKVLYHLESGHKTAPQKKNKLPNNNNVINTLALEGVSVSVTPPSSSLHNIITKWLDISKSSVLLFLLQLPSSCGKLFHTRPRMPKNYLFLITQEPS
jgi:hypothetical protein